MKHEPHVIFKIFLYLNDFESRYSYKRYSYEKRVYLSLPWSNCEHKFLINHFHNDLHNDSQLEIGMGKRWISARGKGQNLGILVLIALNTKFMSPMQSDVG